MPDGTYVHPAVWSPLYRPAQQFDNIFLAKLGYEKLINFIHDVLILIVKVITFEQDSFIAFVYLHATKITVYPI